MKCVTLIALAAVMIGQKASAEVKPLTQERIEDAVKKGQSAKRVSDLCESFDGVRGPWVGGGKMGFSVTILTPYCGLAVRAFNAKKMYEPFAVDKVELLPEDQQFVIVHAEPSSTVKDPLGIPMRSMSFASVAKVVLKRGDEVVQPVKAEFEDVTFSNAYGKKSVYKGGSFSFPLSAFSADTGGVTILIIPETGEAGREATKTLTPDDLRKLY